MNLRTTSRANRGHGLAVLGWSAVVVLAVLAALRILRIEYSAVVVSLETGYAYLFLPAYVVLLFASLTRRRWLGIAASALIACHLTWLAPELLGKQDLPDNVESVPSFRVFSHNIKFDNETPMAIGDDIETADADVVFLEELTWAGWQAVEASGALQPYPYHYIAEAGTDGLGLWSKTPLKTSALVPSPGFPYLRAVIDVGGSDVALYVVHTRAPVSGDVSYWHDDLAQLQTRMSAETMPVVAAGDFNATWQHRPFREMLDAGFEDAAVTTGRGYARTWPLDRFGGSVSGGLIRLDHVLTSDGLVAKTSVEMGGGGSDHRAIYADVAVVSRS